MLRDVFAALLWFLIGFVVVIVGVPVWALWSVSQKRRNE